MSIINITMMIIKFIVRISLHHSSFFILMSQNFISISRADVGESNRNLRVSGSRSFSPISSFKDLDLKLDSHIPLNAPLSCSPSTLSSSSSSSSNRHNTHLFTKESSDNEVKGIALLAKNDRSQAAPSPSGTVQGMADIYI
jgi:hypothetical protein